MTDIPLNPGGDAFPNHVYDALGGGMHLLEKRIGGSILVAEKRPAGGPITLITAGVNRLPVDRGLPVELADQDWDALVTRAGSIDALLDVTRASVIDASAQGAPPITERPVIQTKLHAQHPPRWLTLNNGMFESVTGLESPEYMDEASNHEIVALSNYLARFPWMAEFARSAREGQSAMFVDASGAFTLEN